MYDNINDELLYYVTQATIFEKYDLVAFLEGIEDEKFWSFICDKAIPDKKIEYNYYSQEGHEGKLSILKYKDAILDQKSKAIICIDSDFDYIIGNNEIIKHPFIFQTYVYSADNYFCYANSLDILCKKISIDNENFKFEIFLQNYSKIIAQLLVLDIVLKEELTEINSYYKTSVTPEILINNGDKFLNKLKLIVSNKVSDIEGHFTIDSDKVVDIKNKIFQDPLLHDKFLHLHIKGHIMFSFIKEILNILYKEKYSQNVNKLKDVFSGEKLNQKIKELKNNKPDIKTALYLSIDFCEIEKDCSNLSKIIKEVRQLSDN